MEKLISLAARYSPEAHKKIHRLAADACLSKSEWNRQLVLNAIGMPDEIAGPKTNFGIIAAEKARNKKKRGRKPKQVTAVENVEE